MQYDVNTPLEYLTALQKDWRKTMLLEIRDLILNANNKIEEVIEYNMLSYNIDNKNAFHLNAQKNYVGLYVGDISKIDPTKKITSEYDCGKGCIRIKKTQNISETMLPEFITTTLNKVISDKDITC